MRRIKSRRDNTLIPYGRGAGAIAREILKQGVTGKTPAEAQGWIDAFYAAFPDIYKFLEDCKRKALNPGWVRNAWGRYRRFPRTSDRKLQGDYQREAINFPIQSGVGDAMSVALINLWTFRQYVRTDLRYRILLSVHDAVLLEVPVEEVPEVVTSVFPTCMTDALELPGTGLHFKIGKPDIQLRWGVKADPNELLDRGVPRDFCGFKE